MNGVLSPESAAQKITATLLIALPCIVFLYLALHFCINVPYWDDFNVILDPIRNARVDNSFLAFAKFMGRGSNGHLQVFTHAIAWVQVQYFGGINFRWSTIAGDVGAVISALVLVLHVRKKYGFRFLETVPIAFILLSIVHWEIMDFMVPPWQLYWGSCLFPLLFLMAMMEGYWLLVALMFACAILNAANALALLPIALWYCLYSKQWKESLPFWLTVTMCLFLFFKATFLGSSVRMRFPDVLPTLDYVAAFMGNIVSNGRYKMESIAWLHTIIGVCVITAGIYGLLKIKGGEFFKLVFIFVLAQAFMAVLSRGDLPPRYSLFAVMGLVSVIYLVALHPALQNDKRLRAYYWSAVVAVSIALWMHSLYMGSQPLARDKKFRNNTMLEYQQTKDKSVLAAITHDVDLGEIILSDAKELGVYDYTRYYQNQYRHHQ